MGVVTEPSNGVASWVWFRTKTPYARIHVPLVPSWMPRVAVSLSQYLTCGTLVALIIISICHQRNTPTRALLKTPNITPRRGRTIPAT